jgi:hypothetical protein
MDDGMRQSTDDDFSMVRNAGLKAGMNHGISPDNWFWIVLIGLFVWMYASGGGCCGSGRHGRGKREDQSHQH